MEDLEVSQEQADAGLRELIKKRIIFASQDDNAKFFPDRHVQAIMDAVTQHDQQRDNQLREHPTNDTIVLSRGELEKLLAGHDAKLRERLVGEQQTCYDCIHEDENLEPVPFVSIAAVERVLKP